MPEYPTQPAFIYDFPNHDFDSQTRAHPVLKWLETYLRTVVETHRWSVSPGDHGAHPDAFFKTGSGHATHNADDHFQSARDLHARFADYYNVYDHIIVYETADGWMSLGTANFYFNTNEGVASGKGGTVKSHDGRVWEGVSPGAYRIHYIKDSNGDVQLAGVEIYNGYFQEK